MVLAIDDMRDPAKYEAFLRPILNRLKAIDGRAPVSIMTNQVDPKDPRLQGWLAEGLSLECHTLTHPCPCLQKGDFAEAARTYHGCVDLLNQIPGQQAGRLPDALLRLAQYGEPALLRRDLQQDEPGRPLSLDRLVGFHGNHARRPEPSPRAGFRPRRHRTVPQVHPIPFVREYDRKLSLSLCDRPALLGVSVHCPQ